MSNDADDPDRPTPRHRKPLLIVSDERRQSYPRGVPSFGGHEEEDWTEPRDLFSTERFRKRPGDTVQEIQDLAAEVRRGDLAEQVAKLAITVAANSRRDQSAIQEQGKQLAEFLRVQPGGAEFAQIDGRVEDLAEDIRALGQTVEQKFDKERDAREGLRREVQPAVAAAATGTRIFWMCVAGLGASFALVAWASRTVTQLEDQCAALKEAVTTQAHKLDEIERRQHGDLR